MKDAKHQAKMKVLEDLRRMAHEMMGEDMKDQPDAMKQVSVAAPDKEGLKHGLDMASNLMDQQHPDDEDQEDEDQEESMEPDESSPEDLDKQIQELMARKAALKMKK